MRVKDGVARAYAGVDAARAALAATLLQAYGPKAVQMVTQDYHNKALWINSKALASVRDQVPTTTELIHPVDRNGEREQKKGKRASTKWSTQEVEDATEAYRAAIDEVGGPALSSTLTVSYSCLYFRYF